MIPVISSGGVTSNAGLRALLLGLARRTCCRRPLGVTPQALSTSSPSRSSIGMAWPDSSSQSMVERRDGDVKRDAVPLGQDGLGVGADLVGHLAGAAQRAVAAGDDEVDLAALHQMTGGVVGDDVVRDALLRQFPSGEDGALRARPCLVTKNMERFAIGLCGVHRCGGGADVHERQPAGVAVGQHASTLADERFAVLAKRFAVGDVILGELFGGGQGLLLPLGNGVAGHLRQHPAHGVERIDGGEARLGERVVHLGQVLLERLESTPAKSPCALREPVSRRSADRARAANDHVGDGPAGFAVVGGGDDFEFMREQPLLDEPDAVARLVKPDRPVMPGLTLVGDIHGAGRGSVATELDLQLAPNLLIARVGADVVEVGVGVHPPGVVVAEVDGLDERGDGLVDSIGERVAAGEIVINHRVLREKPGQVLIDGQPVVEAVALRVVVPEQLERLNILGVTLGETLQKADLDVQVPFLLVRKRLSCS